MMYLGSINDQVWKVTENDYAIINPNDPTNQDKINKQCNTMALNTIYNAIDSNVFEQIKDCEKSKWGVEEIRGNIWGHTGDEECQVVHPQG